MSQTGDDIADAELLLSTSRLIDKSELSHFRFPLGASNNLLGMKIEFPFIPIIISPNKITNRYFG